VSAIKKVADRMARAQQKKAAAAEPDEAPVSASADDVERLRRQVAELQAQNTKLRGEYDSTRKKYDATLLERDQERVRNALLAHAQKHNAVDPEEIADLLVRRVRIDGGKVVSADEPDKDAATVVKSYLDARPHHVRGQQSAGSGAPPAPGALPAPPPPAKHDVRTREGATKAAHEHLLKLLEPKSPAPPASGGRGPVA
jgi:regulator of replication initiation timing